MEGGGVGVMFGLFLSFELCNASCSGHSGLVVDSRVELGDAPHPACRNPLNSIHRCRVDGTFGVGGGWLGEGEIHIRWDVLSNIAIVVVGVVRVVSVPRVGSTSKFTINKGLFN